MRRTPFDWPLAIFMATAVIGIWSAYDRRQAMIKFANIAAAVAIYYLLASQGRRNAWLLSGLLGAIGSLIAIYFLLSHDWQVWPADIGVLTRLGVWWMEKRPMLTIPFIHPNIVGGLVSLLLPFQVAFWIYSYRKRLFWMWGSTIILAGISLAGLLLSSSRAAWLALAMAASVWLMWVASEKATVVIRWPRQILFYLFLFLVAVLGVGLSYIVSDGPLSLMGTLPGANNVTSRLDLYRHTVDLIRDFPITGGGLAAFPGLYSQYIAVIPFFLFNYSHNLWLDVALEQSPLGLLSLTWIVAVSCLLLWRTLSTTTGDVRPDDPETLKRWLNRQQIRRDLSLFRWATLIALLVMVLHGLVDDALYGGLGTPLLLVLPGMAVTVSRGEEVKRFLNRSVAPQTRNLFIGLVVLIGIVFGRMILSNGYANLGAVALARVELQDWPTGEWDDGRLAPSLDPASAMFDRAIQIEESNRTAQHRLGLIAMSDRDFETAVSRLEIAHSAGSDHRGIIKSLGYSYLWAGELEKAAVLLADIPEAQQELEVYSHWWKQQERPDLATIALKMARRSNVEE